MRHRPSGSLLLTAGTLLLCLVWLSGCVVSSRDFQSLQKQVYALHQTQKKNNQKIQSRLDALEKQVQQIEQETAERISKGTGPVRSRQAELWSQIESIKVDLATVKGNQDSLRSRLSAISESSSNSTERLAALDDRLTELESNFQTMSSQLGLDLEETAAAGNATSPRRQTEQQTPQLVYDNALRAFQQRDYQEALDLWAEFVDSFPEHDLIANAHFWQGECFYQLQDYARAVLQYQKVIENYPESTKYPPSLLKQGISFYKLGKNKAGRVLLEELINKYPDRAEARRAKRFLQTR